MKGSRNTAIVGSAKNTVYMLLFVDIATFLSPNTINTTRLVRLLEMYVLCGRGKEQGRIAESSSF